MALKEEPMPLQKSHISQLGASSENEKTQPMASCFPCPDGAPCSEMYDFHMGMGSCYSHEASTAEIKFFQHHTEYTSAHFMWMSNIFAS